MRKLTYEEVKEYIESFNYKLLSKEYKNNKEKLKLECPKGHIFEMKYNSFKNGNRCPKCNVIYRTKKQTKSYKEVKNFIESINYKLISKDYHKGVDKLEIECDKGHRVQMSYKILKRGHRCPKCYNLKRGKSQKLSYDEVKAHIEGLGYKLLSKSYENSYKLLEIKCDHGHVFNMAWNKVRSGQGCPTCSYKRRTEKNRTPYSEVKNYLENEGYSLLSDEYINNMTYLTLRCPEGHIYNTTYGNFKNSKSRCPICHQSSGENKITYYLKNNNIKYETQYRFDDCKFYKHLPFDFYLPDYNCCIEYDGIQHYEIINFFGGYDKFIDTKIRDTIKTKYCEDNDINLIRIPYWEIDNIKTILTEEIIN